MSTFEAKLERLSTEKRELLARLLAEQGAAGGVTIRARQDSDSPARLSYGQEQLWLASQVSTSPYYNVPYALRLVGRLDVEALRTAFEALVDRRSEERR